jgi:hypothetical protein
MECVAADARAGTFLAVALLALALGKLTLVRWALPDLLPMPVALLLGLQASLVLGLPVAASHLAAARIMGPVSLYGLWWIALALPIAQKRLAEATPGSPAASMACTTWSWLPTVCVLLHLWAIGWIHQVPFHPAFVTPFLFGLALAGCQGLFACLESVERRDSGLRAAVGQVAHYSLKIPEGRQGPPDRPSLHPLLASRLRSDLKTSVCDTVRPSRPSASPCAMSRRRSAARRSSW